MPIDETDRRLIVLENGKPLEKAPKGLQTRIHAWYLAPENLGALQRWCEARACAYDPTRHAPMTDCKARMIDASASGADAAMIEFMEGAPGDVCTLDQVKHYFRYERHRNDAQIDDMVTSAQFARLLQSKGARRVSDNRFKIKIAGTSFRPWVLRNFDAWCEKTDEIARQRLTAEIAKNGPPKPDTLADAVSPPWKLK